MRKVALILSASFLAGCTATGWRAQQIDGRSLADFERSVAMLQNELPSRRRQLFETSLAILWIRNTTDADAGAGSLESDRPLTLDDVRAPRDDGEEVFSDIRRGDLAFLTASREANEAGSTTEDFLDRLDGLGYEEVVALADPRTDAFLTAMKQYRGARYSCWRLRQGRRATMTMGVVRLQMCDRLGW